MGRRSVILVYPVRPGEDNPQLLHSLRSVAANLPDAEVVLLGHKPSWVRGVHHVPYTQPGVWRGHVPRMIRAFVEGKAPENWVLMNDDFFAVSPAPGVELTYSGTLAQLSRRPGFRAGWYAQALHITRSALRAWEVKDPYSFDRIHKPLPVANTALAEVLSRVGSSDVLIRSLYGNMVGGVEGSDAKLRGYFDPLPETGWVSTGRDSWKGNPGKTLRHIFSRPCRFEV
jgi:hypothetical protein